MDNLSKQQLIVGLGNPGLQYAGTRHNVGFLLLDRLIESLHASPARDGQNYLLWSGTRASGEVVYLMKPLTYMNLSGEALITFLNNHPMEASNILITYDDVSLPLSRIRFRASGSAGGQKGMNHIIEVMQSRDIPRLRLGINSEYRLGRPLPEFVLEPFADEECDTVRLMLDRAAEATELWLREGVGSAMGRFNAPATQRGSESTDSIIRGA